MNLRKTKVYTVIANGSREAILKTMREYLKAGKDPNLRDAETGGNLLHHMIDHAHRFMDPEMVSIIYMLACRDVDIDAQDDQGDTPLHRAVLDDPLRPRENKTVIRILQASNLGARNHQGQTILFEAIAREEPEEIISAILNGGVNVASRDVHGMTARDLAVRMQRPHYVRLIDNYVLKLIKNKDFAKAYVARVFRAVEDGNQVDLQRLLSCRKYAQGRDRCGRTPLLKAILMGQRELVIHLSLQCPFAVPIPDSLGRTALHYAYLFMDDPEVLDLLERHGSSPDVFDVRTEFLALGE
nr:hypothetical protein BaRGS_028724 [Batillaria attramentaria]